MNKKFLIAWLVMFVLYFAFGFIVHGVLLHDDYVATGIMRPEEQQQGMMGLMILAHVMLAGAFTWIYARGVENKPWLGQGLRFGLAVAFLAVIPLYLIYYVVQPLPSSLVCKQIVFDTVCTLILGAVVAFLYRGQGRA
jgi:Protein of unknown function (DUF1761)